MKEPKINYQTNNNAVHKKRFGKTNRFPDKSTAICTQRQMLAFNSLRILFSCFNTAVFDMIFIRKIIVRENHFNIKRHKQLQQFIKIFMLSRTETICQRFAGYFYYFFCHFSLIPFFIIYIG